VKRIETIEEIIRYIENAEIAMPIGYMFNDHRDHITKKEYGKVLIHALCKDLKKEFLGIAEG